MAHASARLTHVEMTALLKRAGRFPDGQGLYLDSRPPRASWVFRYTLSGRARWMGLGRYPEISLKAAREKAFEARRLLDQRSDPIAVRDAERAEQQRRDAEVLTFQDCAEGYIAAHRDSWANEKHAAQWASTLTTYAYPLIGHLPVSEIDVPLVTRVLNQDVKWKGKTQPLWSVKNETASRVRGRIESVLAWAASRNLRSWDNPASWAILRHQLPPRSRVARRGHHTALPYDEVSKFMQLLKNEEGAAALALQLTIFTAARTSEILKATWDEFDIANKVWTVPASRMKAKREHRVPLSDAAIAVLEKLVANASDRANWVFPNATGKKPLSNMVMLMLLRRMKLSVTVHGFRSTFRDWAAEATSHPSDIAEMALAHTIKNKVEAAYRRGDLFTKRIALMDDWAAYCGG